MAERIEPPYRPGDHLAYLFFEGEQLRHAIDTVFRIEELVTAPDTSHNIDQYTAGERKYNVWTEAGHHDVVDGEGHGRTLEPITADLHQDIPLTRTDAEHERWVAMQADRHRDRDV